MAALDHERPSVGQRLPTLGRIHLVSCDPGGPQLPSSWALPLITPPLNPPNSQSSQIPQSCASPDT